MGQGERPEMPHFQTVAVDSKQAVNVGDMRVHVSGTGPALICVHGFTTTSEFWKEQIEPFSRDHLLIRPNLPGHGISPHPRERDYTIEAFVGDLEGLFRHFRIKTAVLVGLSMGGTISQQFALRNPKLLQGLVLVGATPHGFGPDVKAENVIRAIEDVGIVTASQNVIERSFGSAAPRALVEFAKKEVVQTPEFVARAAIKSLNESDSRPLLETLSVPTLVIVGDEDVITPPSESKALAAGIPEAELAIIAQAGHFPMLEQPAAFNQVLQRFINRCGG
jgi:3-oxoadipate enol-lactonase